MANRERNEDHERAAVARLAAAFGNTDEGRDLVADHLDLDRLAALCERSGLDTPADVKVRPGVAQIETTITNPALRRSITCMVAISEAPLPKARQTMTIAAGDRLGPRLSGLEAADYLATAYGATGQLLGEVRSQLTAAAAALYEGGQQMRQDQLRTQRIPNQVWSPTPQAIDALSELLEQDARWKATMLVNDWYIRTVDSIQAAERVTPHQAIQVDDSGLHQLPPELCELLNEHWRAVYTNTVNQQLHIIDALDTPGEVAMRSYLDAQELREMREATDTARGDFPGPTTGDRPPDSQSPDSRSPDSRSPDSRSPDSRDPGMPPDQRPPDWRPPGRDDQGDDLDR